MKALRAWYRRLAAVFASDRHELELSAEIESNLQMHIDDNVRAGMTPDDARRVAIEKLGGVNSAKQAYRERDRFLLVEHLLQDLRFAYRQMVKYPGFTVTATLVLALGIGASVAIFAFVDAALIKPLPYADPTRLAHVTESVEILPRADLSYFDYLDWKKQNTVLKSLDVYTGSGFMLSTPSGGELVAGARVSDGFFRTLGVAPIIGRDFYAGEDLPQAAPTVMLTYPAWQNRFGGSKDVIGQVVTLSGIPMTIIGVLPREFQFAPRGGAEMFTTLRPSGECEARRSCHNLEGIGRLKDGVTIEAARAEFTLIAQQLEKQYPASNRGQGASVLPLSEVIVGDVRPILLLLLGGSALLLLIACINVASLLLVRSESRRREITIRGALGASPGRLLRQFVAEAFVLVVSGGLAGLGVAAFAIRLLSGLMSRDMLARMPFLAGLGMNLHVLAFAVGMMLLAGTMFSLTPLARIPNIRVREGLISAERGSAGRWRHFGAKLVVVELAVAMVLLVAAGLLGKSFYRLLNVDIGFEPEGLAMVQLMAPQKLYPKDADAIALGRQVIARVTALPGVKSAALVNRVPISNNGNTNWVRIPGRPYNGEHNEVMERDVTDGLFTTLRTKLISGRYFKETDDEKRPNVVIVNRSFAKRFFPNEDPIGKKLGDTDLSEKSMREIVGVVEDIKEGQLDVEPRPAMYVPFNQSPDNFFSLIVRTEGDEKAILPSLSAAIHEVAPNVGTVGETTMSDRIYNSPSAYLHRSASWLLAGFAALALVLGVVGLYGVIAYSVSQRTREIGVRVALGAQRGMIYQLILREAGWLTCVGIICGLGGSLAMSSLLRGLLFGVGAWDPSTLAGVAAVMGTAALLASFVPARRAASVDPTEALRAE